MFTVTQLITLLGFNRFADANDLFDSFFDKTNDYLKREDIKNKLSKSEIVKTIDTFIQLVEKEITITKLKDD